MTNVKELHRLFEAYMKGFSHGLANRELTNSYLLQGGGRMPQRDEYELGYKDGRAAHDPERSAESTLNVVEEARKRAGERIGYKPQPLMIPRGL